MSTPNEESAGPVGETGLNEAKTTSGDHVKREPDTGSGKDDSQLAAGEGGSSGPSTSAADELGFDGQRHSSPSAELGGAVDEERVVDHVVHEDENSYPEPEAEEELLPPPDFKPFFTLVESSETGEHHHPTVHYVFADDDPEILINGALESLASQQEDVAGERFVILDLSADGKDVQSATSLSPDWQALKTQITPAPSWGGDDSGDADRGLMLRVSGQEAKRATKAKGKKQKEDVEGLLKAFDEKMTRLDGVLGTDVAIDTPSVPQERVHEIDSV